MQRLKQGKLTAKMLLETHNPDKYIHVRAYGEIITAIVVQISVINVFVSLSL